MSLHEKGRVLRLIVTLMGRAMECESIFPVKMTHHCRSLTSMGAGTVMGLAGCPIFTRPTAVWKHLERLRTYGEARWAQKQKARTAKRQAKTKGLAKKLAAKPSGDTTNPERKRCPAKGGAKSALKHYATDFYAKPEKALAEQRNEVFAPAAGAVEDRGGGRPAAPIFTPPATRNGARKKETRRRLTKSLVCERQGSPPCSTCRLTRRGVRHCCSRGHHGRPKGVCMPCTPRHTPLRARLASQRTPGAGGTPVLKRLMGRAPPRGPACAPWASPPTRPSGGVRGMKRQKEAPPQPRPGKRPCLARPAQRHGRVGTEVT